jgi:sugar phosphate isomerase/epimerase
MARSFSPALDRRALLGAGLSLALVGPAAARNGFFASRRLKVGLQLYTLGPAVARDLEGTLKRVAEIGFGEVELAGYNGRKPEELRAAADKAGLKITSVHVAAGGLGGPNLDWDPARLAADFKVLGATEAVVPMIAIPPGAKPNPGEDFGAFVVRLTSERGAEFWKALARRLNDRGAALKAAGVNLGYHNHNFEFAPVAGTTGWDILVGETDPRLVSLELDVGWVAAAGLDPVATVRKLSGRVTKMHVKDILPSTKTNFVMKQDPTEVGFGTIDWKRLLPAAYKAGVRHFYVEQEPPFRFERLESVAKSYAFLTQKV